MDADAELDAAVRRQPGIALYHGVLHLERTAYGVDDAAEFDKCAVAGAFHHPAVVHGDCRIEEIAAQRPQARQRAIFVAAGQPAEANHVRRENRRELPVLGHESLSPTGKRVHSSAGTAIIFPGQAVALSQPSRALRLGAAGGVAIARVTFRDRKGGQPGFATNGPEFVGRSQLVRSIQGSQVHFDLVRAA